jgi:hypothetical protein
MSTPHFKTPENEYAARILLAAKQANDKHVFAGFNLTMNRVQTACTYARALALHLHNKIKY